MQIQILIIMTFCCLTAGRLARQLRRWGTYRHTFTTVIIVRLLYEYCSYSLGLVYFQPLSLHMTKYT